MPYWGSFFVVIVALVVVLIVLTRLTERALEAGPEGRAQIGDSDDPDAHEIGTAELYLNVVLSQGLFGAVIIGTIWWLDVPIQPLGVGTGDLEPIALVVLGVVFGAVLYLLNEASVSLLDLLGIDYSEELRALLAPSSIAGWLVLLLVVLPVIAAFEELLFRAVLIGAATAATGWSPWLFALVSSLIFAVGHGVQGTGGILVTGVLGFFLAVAFILTESLLVVIVAHYIINASEFILNEGIGIDPFSAVATNFRSVR